VVRCAIYTRKSTDAGLDSDFSSIDNQREACEAFIRSQREEGWIVVDERFDDGGFSGGTIERPALKRLLTLIQAGEIDCVVVYKIDRLSRSLLDFVRLLELFELHHCAFVGVTQQINTTTSAGRLMLNVLMSFAQFEREIGSERTREKIHAARKKGRYTGGTPPLGYDLDRLNHRLVVNPQEAEMVRELYTLYITHNSLLEVVKAVNARGWTRKSWLTARETRRGGREFDKVYLQRLLTNPLYLGQITLHDEIYPGLHEPIVDVVIFDQVQRMLDANRNGAGPLARNRHGAILKGLLRCGRCGSAMAHSYTKKDGKLYRYYRCSRAEKQSRSACQTPPVSAGEIESQMIAEIRRFAADPAMVDQVFAEVITQQREQGEKLESERTRLLRERQQRQETIRRLVDSIGSADNGSGALLSRRMGELQASIALIEDRLAAVDSDRLILRQHKVDRLHLDQTLLQFTDLWDALYPGERCRLVRSLVSKVVYDDLTDSLQIEFKAQVQQSSAPRSS
jgi:site-specific DNA recombinase